MTTRKWDQRGPFNVCLPLNLFKKSLTQTTSFPLIIASLNLKFLYVITFRYLRFNAKSLQSCPTLCNPIDGSPPGFLIPGILQARTLEWIAISFSKCMKVKSESEVAQSCPTLSDPMNCSPPGSSIHGIFQARVLEWGAIAFSGKVCRLRLFGGCLLPEPCRTAPSAGHCWKCLWCRKLKENFVRRPH